MPAYFTPQDASAILAATVREATGQETTIQQVNTSNFASVGQTVLNTGKENTFNALSAVIFRTMIMAKRYTQKLKVIRTKKTSLFEQTERVISYYAKDPMPAANFNTNLWTNFQDGFTNGQNPDANGVPQSLKSMWEQNPPIPFEQFFLSCNVWDDCLTLYSNQIDAAFRGPEELARFANGYALEKENDIESQKEAYSRLTLLNYLAMIYDQSSRMPGSARNMTSEYNTKFGTSYTSAQLRTTYLKSFLEFFVAEVKTDILRLENRSALYHDAMPITIDGIQYSILRSSDRRDQRLLMYAPFWKDAEAMVMSEIFNENYLKIDNFEEIMFWQNEYDHPESIDVVPGVYDPITGTQIAGNRVQIDYVLGTLHDGQACEVDFKLDDASATPWESRKKYRNIWYHMAQGSTNNPTMKGILYYMAD